MINCFLNYVLGPPWLSRLLPGVFLLAADKGLKIRPFRNRLVGAKTSPLEFSRDLVDNFRLLEKNPISAENGRPVATKS